jgi:hypothetical protein
MSPRAVVASRSVGIEVETDMDDGDPIEQLAQPVNSAAYWAHLYVEDEVEVVVDLTAAEEEPEVEPLAPVTT